MKNRFTSNGPINCSRYPRQTAWTSYLLFGLALIAHPTWAQEFAGEPPSDSERFHLIVDGPKLVELHGDFELTVEGITQDGELIARWDTIVGGTVNADRQRAFDEFRTLVGIPISRIRRGIEAADWPLMDAGMDACEWERIQDSAHSRSLWLAADTLLNLKNGQRDKALLSMIKFQQSLAESALQKNDLVNLPMISWMATPSTELTPRPLPIWFDSDAVSELRRQLEAFAETSPSTTLEIHCAALALSAEDYQALEARVQKWSASDNETLSRWARLFPVFAAIQRHETSSDIIRLEQSLETMSLSQKGSDPLWFWKGLTPFGMGSNSGALPWVTRYWLNMAMTERARSSQQFRRAIVNWLELASETQDVDREFSAAAIFQAVMIATNHRWHGDARRLSEYLLKEFPETWHARHHLIASQKNVPGPRGGESGE